MMSAQAIFGLVAELMIGKNYIRIAEKSGERYLRNKEVPITPPNHKRHLSDDEVAMIGDFFGNGSDFFIKALNEARVYTTANRARWCKIILEKLTGVEVMDDNGSPVEPSYTIVLQKLVSAYEA